MTIIVDELSHALQTLSVACILQNHDRKASVLFGLPVEVAIHFAVVARI